MINSHLSHANDQREQLLSQFFLLVIENRRLEEAIKKVSHAEPPQNDVLVRISEIEDSLVQQLKDKESKIMGLNNKIRCLHSNCSQLQQNLSKSQNQYKKLEKRFSEQLNEYKSEIGMLRQQRKAVTVLEEERDLYREQLKSINETTVPGLEEDIRMLNRENANYMQNIHSYQQELSRREQIISSLKDNERTSRQTIEQQKTEFKQQSSQLENSLKQLQQLHDKELKQLLARHQASLKTASEQKAQLGQQLAVKSAKLQEYDRQYQAYNQKMKGLQNDISKLRAANTVLAQAKQEQEKACDSLMKQSLRKQKECEKLQQENKTIKLSLEDKSKIVRQLQSSIEQSHQREKSYRERINSAQAAKSQAITQWEQLLSEMNKQKDIIVSMEKQIDNYRRTQYPAVTILSGGCGTADAISKANQNHLRQTDNKYSAEDVNKFQHRTMQNQFKPHNLSLRIPKERKWERGNLLQQTVIESTSNGTYKDQVTKVMNADYRHMRVEDQHQISQMENRQASRALGNCCEECKERKSVQKSHQNQHSVNTGFKRNQQSFITAHSESLHSRNNRSSVLQGNQKERINHSVQKQNSLRLSSNHLPSREVQWNHCSGPSSGSKSNLYRQSNHPQERSVTRSSSLKIIKARDQNLDKMQQYLSFDLNPGLQLNRQESDRKIVYNGPFESERTGVQGLECGPRMGGQKGALMERMNKLNSWRQECKGAKNIGCLKRTIQNPSQISLNGQQKENLNEIIQKKCMYI